jgi:uncharacterized small protein (DUF1192 family)
MIKKFDEFIKEMVSSQDMKNNLDLNIEKGDATNPANNQPQQQQNQAMQKNANLKVTDIQARINTLNQQKQAVNQEILKLQDAQRDLRPNNPNDPQNAQKQKVFDTDQQTKIKIQQDKLKVLEAEIQNLQQEIARNKEKYLL